MKRVNHLFCTVLLLTGPILTTAGQEGEDEGMADMFVHPFLDHMALPDRPGEMSLRVTPFQQRVDFLAERDMTLQIEA